MATHWNHYFLKRVRRKHVLRCHWGGNDKLKPESKSVNNKTSLRPSGCALCADHFPTYQQHIVECTCSVYKCTNVGLPYPNSGGMVYECAHHTKARIAIPDATTTKVVNKPISPKRGVEIPPPKVEQDDSPIMPSLEPLSAEECHALPHSAPNATLSTGSSVGKLEGRRKEMGGRTPVEPNRQHKHRLSDETPNRRSTVGVRNQGMLNEPVPNETNLTGRAYVPNSLVFPSPTPLRDRIPLPPIRTTLLPHPCHPAAESERRSLRSTKCLNVGEKAVALNRAPLHRGRSVL